jgi:hypothetical protein
LLGDAELEGCVQLGEAKKMDLPEDLKLLVRQLAHEPMMYKKPF